MKGLIVFIRSLSRRQHGLIEEYVKEEMRHTSEEKLAAAGGRF